MREFFNPLPQKNANIFQRPKAGLQIFLTPLTSRPPPTAGLKMANPLVYLFGLLRTYTFKAA